MSETDRVPYAVEPGNFVVDADGLYVCEVKCTMPDAEGTARRIAAALNAADEIDRILRARGDQGEDG